MDIDDARAKREGSSSPFLCLPGTPAAKRALALPPGPPPPSNPPSPPSNGAADHSPPGGPSPPEALAPEPKAVVEKAGSRSAAVSPDSARSARATDNSNQRATHTCRLCRESFPCCKDTSVCVLCSAVCEFDPDEIRDAIESAIGGSMCVQTPEIWILLTGAEVCTPSLVPVFSDYDDEEDAVLAGARRRVSQAHYLY